MSDSSSANSNSWTILAPEETVTETLRPVAEGTEHHVDVPDDLFTKEPTAETRAGQDGVTAEDHSVDSQQAPQEVDLERMEDTVLHEQHITPDPHPTSDPNPVPDGDGPSPSTSEATSPVPDPNLSPDPDPDLTSVTEDHPPSSLEVPASSSADLDTASQLAGLSESTVPPTPDSFSESYTHISLSEEEAPGFPLAAETLGANGLSQEEAELLQEEEAVHQLNGEELGHEEEESELSHKVTEVGKQAVYLVDQLVMDLFRIWARKLAGQAVAVQSEAGDEWAEVRGEEGVRKRRGSLLAALERIGRRDEEDEEMEDFQLPQREDETGFSLNKCILGAVILLGLGTIFFSGVFMDLDEEGEYDVREMRDSDVAGKQEWLNPEVPPPPVDVSNPDLLNKLAKDKEQMTVLQAQLKAQKEELKVAQGQAAEGAKERLRREEVEKENGRLKKEMMSLPVLQKENEKMKRELESVRARQREVERLRTTVTELKHSPANEAAPPPVLPAALPSSGPEEDGRLDTDGTAEKEGKKLWEGEKIEKKKEWTAGKEWTKKEESGQEKPDKGWKDKGGKKEWKPEKEWKKGKRDEEKESQGWKQREEKEGWKGKKEKSGRGDEGKPWKAREENEEGRGKNEGKDWKEKKGKHEKWNDGKEWKSTSEKKGKKGGKDRSEWKKDKDEWKGEKEWRHKKEGEKVEKKKEWKEGKEWKKKKEESGQGKQGKEWKEKGEKKGWKGDKDWKKKDGKKDGGKEWKVKEEKKPWHEKEKEMSKDGDRKKEGWKQGKQNGDWKKDKGHYKSKDGHKQDEHEKSHHHHPTEGERGRKEKLWQGSGEESPPHTHRRPPLEHPDYWLHQRQRLQHNPSPQTQCTSVETCAQAEGLVPVPLPEFQALLLGYLAKAEGVGVEASRREELSKLALEFFRDGVFAHDQMSFQDFVEDVEEILEDMVEGEEEDDDDEDEGIEKEMDGFEEEAMKKFAVPVGGETGETGETGERKRGERKKETERGRG